MIPLHRIPLHAAFAVAALGVAGCLELPARLYACAPDGGCPAGLSCGDQQLCVPVEDGRDAGDDGTRIAACSTTTGQLGFSQACQAPAAGCGPDLGGTWCTTGGCVPLVPFPALDAFCKGNGAPPAWIGHSGFVRGGRVFHSDGGTMLLSRRDEQVEISVDMLLFEPCLPGGTCEETRVELEALQGGLKAACVEEGPGCRCSLRWTDSVRRAQEIQLGLGQYTELPDGAAWNVCVGGPVLSLEAASSVPAVVFTYERP